MKSRLAIVGSFSELPREWDLLVTGLYNIPLALEPSNLHPTSRGLRTEDQLQQCYDEFAAGAIATLLIVGQGISDPDLDLDFTIADVEFQYIRYWHLRARSSAMPFLVALWCDTRESSDEGDPALRRAFSQLREVLGHHHWCFRFSSADQLFLRTVEFVRAIQEGRDYPYDVAISFSGHDRTVARQISSALRSRGLRVFMDEEERHETWGRTLPDVLSEVYGRTSRYCVVLSSAHYAASQWAMLELDHALQRQQRQDSEYILQLRLDETALPLPTSQVFLDYVDADTAADVITRKVRSRA